MVSKMIIEPTKADRKAAKRKVKAQAKARRRAEAATYRTERAAERAVREELWARQASGFTFHDDGTVEYVGHGWTTTRQPRALLLDVAFNDGRVSNPIGHRLLQPSKVGTETVTIVTDAWVQTVNKTNLTKLYGLALQAKARAQR